MRNGIAIVIGRACLLALAGLGVACEDDSGTEMIAADAATPANSEPDATMPDGEPVVSLSDGELQGKTDGPTYAFLGIPYAKPPLGELRFANPEKNEPWEGMREATEFGKRCAQLASATLQNAASEDEDCLYLNVWTADPTTTEKKPVMVWIHGGGNRNGSASEPVPFANTGVFYSGRDLAQDHDVVVVTLNYRLGVLGFLNHPGLSASNQGLRDQVLALEWVRDNIAAFGGDPDQVTIFGESAGSFDVCMHMASPLSRGLFHRAISQSGGCTTTMTTKSEGEAAGEALAADLCDGADDALTCLREASVADLLDFQPAADSASFGPVVDADFMPDQAGALYAAGEIADVPYMLGSNSDEGTLFSMQNIADEAAYQAALEVAFPGIADDVAALYPLADFAEGKPTPGSAALVRALGDSRLVCSTYDTAVLAQAAGRDVYMYNFDIPVEIPGLDLNLGATHGAELTYVFGTSPAFSPDQMDISNLMQRYWSRFATTGDPNGGDDLEWPVFGADPNKRMNFSLEPALVDDFRTAQCDFWRGVYAAL